MQNLKWAVLFFCFSMGNTLSYAIEFRPIELELKQNFASYLQPLENHNDLESRTDLELMTHISHKDFGLRLNPWVRMRDPYPQGGEDKRHHFNIELKEGWIEKVEENWEIRLGNQIFTWGASDWMSPTDIWNGRDLVDPFAPVKLPLLAARLSIHPQALQNMEFEIIYSPQFRAHRLPVKIPNSGSNALNFSTQDSRWLMPLPNQVTLSTDQTLPINYEIASAVYSEQWEIGTRLRLINQKNWDFSFVTAQFVNPMPHFKITTRGSLSSPSLPIITTFRPIYYRMNMVGADIAGNIGGVGLRLETAFLTPVKFNEDEIPERSLFVVTGVDYVLGQIYLAKFVANFSYIYRYRKFKDNDPSVFGLRELTPWINDLAGQLEVQFKDKYAFGVRGIHQLDSSDAWIHPFVRVTFDTFELGVNADLFVGNEEGFYGQYRYNERINALLKMSF